MSRVKLNIKELATSSLYGPIKKNSKDKQDVHLTANLISMLKKNSDYSFLTKKWT